MAKFDKLGVKETERSEPSEVELDSKQRKPNARQLVLAQAKENKVRSIDLQPSTAQKDNKLDC